MDLGLNGRVALVAAASRGLGKAVATTLSEEGARGDLHPPPGGDRGSSGRDP